MAGGRPRIGGNTGLAHRPDHLLPPDACLLHITCFLLSAALLMQRVAHCLPSGAAAAMSASISLLVRRPRILPPVLIPPASIAPSLGWSREWDAGRLKSTCWKSSECAAFGGCLLEACKHGCLQDCWPCVQPFRTCACMLRRVDSSIGHQRGDPQGGEPGQQHKPFNSITLQVASILAQL